MKISFNDREMTEKQLSNYYDNRLIKDSIKLHKMIDRLNDQIEEYNKSLEYSNKHDVNIALKYSFKKVLKIDINK